jgi:hypothetical protein
MITNNVEICYELYKQKENEIDYEIKNQFKDSNFVFNLDDSLIESGSEIIESIEVVDLVNIGNSELINPKDLDNFDVAQIIVTFELLVEVKYEIPINYRSLEFASRYREDDRYFGAETKNGFASGTRRFPVEIQLEISKNKDGYLCNPRIKDIDINPNGDLDEIIISEIVEYEDTM